MPEHTLILLGGAQDQLRVSAATLHEAIGTLLEGARLATRFAVDGESARTGPRPAWLDSACAIDITGLTAGSACLTMQAPTLQEADPTKFGIPGQRSLFEEHERSIISQTAIELFGDVLAALMEQPDDEITADRPLLDACLRFAKLSSSSGVEGVRIEGLRKRSTPLLITPAQILRIEQLRDQTQNPQAVRVSGVLDTISASRTDVILKLKSGSRLLVRMDAPDLTTLITLFGQHVVVSGVAHYRPSGQPLLIHAQSITEAGPNDSFFEAAPLARSRRLTSPLSAQDNAAGVSAFFGAWPGEESEDELLVALEDIG